MTNISPDLIRQAVAGAERSTGKTKALWLALFRLLCHWYRE